MPNHWNLLISKLPDSHFLQTWEWACVKAAHGWTPLYAVWLADGRFLISQSPADLPPHSTDIQAACLVLKKQVLKRGFSARLSILYAPKGPLLDWGNVTLRERVLQDLQSFASRQGAIFLKIDPDLVLGEGFPDVNLPDTQAIGVPVRDLLTRRRWVYSSSQIQFRNTVLIDLCAPEEDLLLRMKPKTRYNIRLSEKKGVSVTPGKPEQLPLLYKMYAETSVRDGFVIRDQSYYLNLWQSFMNNLELPPDPALPVCQPLVAWVDGEPVAGLFLFMFAGRAYYVYGMSRALHREKMPTYLLQWRAIQRARAHGCQVYDLWGAPEVFDENDSLWGVFRFKEGLGGRVVRTLGAYDFAPVGLWYWLYTRLMPRLLDLMRSRGRQKTRQELA